MTESVFVLTEWMEACLQVDGKEEDEINSRKRKAELSANFLQLGEIYREEIL